MKKKGIKDLNIKINDKGILPGIIKNIIIPIEDIRIINILNIIFFIPFVLFHSIL